MPRLLLLLLVPVSVALGPERPDSTFPIPSPSAEGPRVHTVREPPVLLEVAPARDAARVSNREESSAVAQPSTRHFLYQVLLAAVSALVTALIWKAVF